MRCRERSDIGSQTTLENTEARTIANVVANLIRGEVLAMRLG